MHKYDTSKLCYIPDFPRILIPNTVNTCHPYPFDIDPMILQNDAFYNEYNHEIIVVEIALTTVPITFIKGSHRPEWVKSKTGHYRNDFQPYAVSKHKLEKLHGATFETETVQVPAGTVILKNSRLFTKIIGDLINVNSHKPHVYFNITPGIINRLDGVNGPCYSLSNERYFELIRREFETKWKFGMPSGASSQQTIPYHQKPQKRLFEIVKFPSHLKRQKKKDISRVIKHGGISKKNSSPLTPPIHSLFVTKDGFAF